MTCNNLLTICLATLCLCLSGCISTQKEATQGDDSRQAVTTNAVENKVTKQPIKLPTSLLATSNQADEQQLLAVNNNLWFALRDGFSLPLTDNQRVTAQRNWFIKNPSYMARVSKRAEPYLHYIKTALEEHKLPLEMALLPVVESAYEPFAYSHGRAAGIWQFVPSTGKSFGMDINWWYDGRRDIQASTQGAIKFLNYLNKRFDGDWLHALAAYNSGEGRVRREIRKNKEQGKPTDFWHLNLPKETKDYVPKLLALASLLKDCVRYNFNWPHIDNQAYLTTVNVSSQIDLSVAAGLAKIPLDHLHRLNPGFNRWATDPDGHHELLIPITSQALFSQGLDMLSRKQRVNWTRHKVVSGESLSKLAVNYQTTKQVIMDVNQLSSDTIGIGQYLMIPVAVKALEDYKLTQQQRLAKTQNTPKGQIKLTHKVVSGDTLWDLSRHYGVGLTSLAKWNQLAPKDPIRPGMSLVIWSSTSSKTNADSIIRKLTYTVRRGDSLSRIAGKFNLTVNEILKWNSLSAKRYLKPGQKLKLFVDVTRS